MNSLNLLSARVIGASDFEKSQGNRKRSYSEGNSGNLNVEGKLKRSASQHANRATSPYRRDSEDDQSPTGAQDTSEIDVDIEDEVNEKKPLLSSSKSIPNPSSGDNGLRLWTKRLVDALTASLKWVLSTLAAPGAYLIHGFYAEDGHFSMSAPLHKLSRLSFNQSKAKYPKQELAFNEKSGWSKEASRWQKGTKEKRKGQKKDSNSSMTSQSEEDFEGKLTSLKRDINGRTRPQTSSSSDEIPQIRRSTRLRGNNEDLAKRRKYHRDRDNVGESGHLSHKSAVSHLLPDNIKSPTSPGSSLQLKNAPLPPRPLIPPRQPSYSLQLPRASRFSQKTLVIDLDETLIHSLAKGGRMSSGHMVEVKLNNTVGVGSATLGPQHPILYYVHKRPHCDDFLRRVCKWYNLVVFTASVQEYADPVIDWLEQERKYFSNRFYRQHCTFRNGAYIKDLSSVEPDLSKVMILDNSPLSYIFHEGKLPAGFDSLWSPTTLTIAVDNAIPIEGWINDPTDNDLLHLVPILEALQYVTDVRAILGLRRGEGNASL